MTEQSELSATQREIVEECDALKALLLRKNAAYGDSVMHPMRVFSRASVSDAIRVRLDDKISRLARGSELPDEKFSDTIDDLIGYLVLLQIAEKRASRFRVVENAAIADVPVVTGDPVVDAWEAEELAVSPMTLADVFPEPAIAVSAVDTSTWCVDGALPEAKPRFSLETQMVPCPTIDAAIESVRRLRDAGCAINCVVSGCHTYPRALVRIVEHNPDATPMAVTCCRSHVDTRIARAALEALLDDHGSQADFIEWHSPADDT